MSHESEIVVADHEIEDHHKFSVQMSKIVLPKLINDGSNEEELYYGGIEQPKESFSLEMLFVQDSGEDAFAPDKRSLVMKILFDGEKTSKAQMREIVRKRMKLSIIGVKKLPEDVLPAKVTVFSEEDKMKLIAANGTKICHEGEYHTVSVKVHTSQTRFKGLINIKELPTWNLVTFKKRLLRSMRELNPEFDLEKDLDLFQRKDRETGMLKPTGMFTILFKGSEKVEQIEFCDEMYDVEEYRPEPKRCFRCAQFGHSKGECPNNDRCFDCNEELHGDSKCKVKRNCANCSGTDHNTMSRDCPMRFFKMRIDDYCRKYEVNQDEILNFAYLSTKAYEKELKEAETTAEKNDVKFRWKKTFQGGKEQKNHSSAAQLWKAKAATSEFVKKIVDKPAKTLNWLGSIYQRMDKDFRSWTRQNRMERRVKSSSDLSQLKRMNQRFSSQLDLNSQQISNFSAMPRLEQVRREPNKNTGTLPKVAPPKPIEEMDESELEEGISSDAEEKMIEEFGPSAITVISQGEQSESEQDPDTEKEEISISSQVSEDNIQSSKVKKKSNGAQKKIVIRKSEVELLLASNAQTGGKRDHNNNPKS